MPAQYFETKELDQATLDYLHQVVENEGQGMPGLYYDAEDGKVAGSKQALWGFVAGPVVMLLTLFFTYDSIRSPTPVALLMTGGYFLGGWLLVYATRSAVARNRKAYVGYFEYLDPLYLWRGRGTAVEVEPLGMVTGTEPMGERVRIEKADGDVVLELRTPGLVDEVCDYLAAVPEAHGTDPVKRGYEAKARVREEEEVARIDEIPSPRREHPARGWVMPLALVASMAVLFFCCKSAAVWMRDEAVYEVVKGKGPGHLRVYLMDPRNTRYRAEVVKELESFHNEVAARFENGKGDPEVRAGMANIIRGLKDHARPLVTVRFAASEKGPSVPEGYFSSAVQAEQNLHILGELRRILRPLVGVSKVEAFVPLETIDLVDLAQVTEGPAMILVEAKVKPADKGPGECVITWTVSFQADPEGDKKVSTFDARMAQPQGDPAPTVRALYRNFVDTFRPRIGG